jgi:hypothetical protein
MRMDRLWVLGVAMSALLMFGSRPSPAATMGMGDEIKTAITHAGFAEKYDSMKDVSMHLHHVINCLVGPADPMFDKMAGNPCQGQGRGIMPDIKASMGVDQEYQVAWWLAHLADQAIKMGNLAQAKAAAHIIGVQLTAMSKM